MLNKLCFNKIGHILFCRIKDDHENFLKSNLPDVSQGLTNLAKFIEKHIFNYSHIVVPDLHFFFQKLRGGTFEIYRVSGSCWRRTKPGRSKSTFRKNVIFNVHLFFSQYRVENAVDFCINKCKTINNVSQNKYLGCC